MVVGVCTRVCIFVIFARIHRSFGVRDFEATLVKSGSKPNECAAIIGQCRKRCDSSKIGVTEYVQMTIKLLNNDTTCITATTSYGEPVPVNPNNTNHFIVVFTVPCCQQQGLNGSCGNSNDTFPQTLPTSPEFPIRDEPNKLSTTPATKEAEPTTSVAGCNSQQSNQPRAFAPIEILLLTFVILCFILLCIILGILLKSRRWTKKTITTNPPQVNGNHHTPPESTTAVVFDKDSGDKRKIDCHVNDAVGECSRNGSVANLGSDNSYGNVEDTSPSSDYVILPNQSFPPAPKSARPSRSRQEGSSEEIIIVGARNVITSPILENESPSNAHQIPTKFLKSSNDLSIENGKIPERPRHNTEKTEHDVVRYVNKSDLSGPHAFATTGRLVSKGMPRGPSTNDYENPEFSRNRAQTEIKDSSWDSSTNDQNDSIYNRLRSKKNDDPYSDYQRLLRQSQIQENADVEGVPYDDVTPTTNANGGYVTIASKGTILSNGKHTEGGTVKLTQVSENL